MMEENNTQTQNSVPENNSPMAPEAQLPVGHNKVMAILAYLGILVVVSYLVAKDDSFVKFHIKQGLVLLVIEIAVWILSMVFMPSLYYLPGSYSMMGIFAMVVNLIWLVIIVLSILGIVNAVNDREKPLPIIGSFAKYFNI